LRPSGSCTVPTRFISRSTRSCWITRMLLSRSCFLSFSSRSRARGSTPPSPSEVWTTITFTGTRSLAGLCAPTVFATSRAAQPASASAIPARTPLEVAMFSSRQALAGRADHPDDRSIGRRLEHHHVARAAVEPAHHARRARRRRRREPLECEHRGGRCGRDGAWPCEPPDAGPPARAGLGAPRIDRGQPQRDRVPEVGGLLGVAGAHPLADPRERRELALQLRGPAQ